MPDEEIQPAQPAVVEPDVVEEDAPEALAPDTRPARNVLAEIQRRDREARERMTKIERQNADILAAVQALQRPAAAPVAPAATEGAQYTDEQLGQLAAAGNAEALRILVDRQTKRQTEAQFSQFRQSQTVQTALTELLQRYPVLRDQAHPLTQAVYAARAQFLASGWAPGPQTDLEAIKAAIVNAPHLVPAPDAVAPDTTRRAGVTAQQSMDGAASRRSPQSQQTQSVRPLDKKVAGIAQRMGVKDPQGSVKRFEERQQQGRSTVSPMIQQAVREEQP